MPRPNPHRPFTPDPAQMALHPGISGNAVNGLDERDARRPRVVYWAPEPADIPHGRLQLWFYTRADDPVIHEERANRQMFLDAPLPRLATTPVELTAEDWTTALIQFERDGTCVKVGVTAVNQLWVFEDQEVAWKNLIMLGFRHNYDEIALAPGIEAGREVMRQYTHAAAGAKRVAGWLRQQGWDAEPVTGPMASRLTLIPHALEAGFGELGKHGSIINPEMGASFRLSGVLTDAPLAPTPRQEHSIDGFCMNCRICEDACPPEALSPAKQMVRGVAKWYVDFDRCLPFFNQTAGCAICIAVCPWSRPGVGPNLAAKLRARANRIARSEVEEHG
jgi:epoxyqueuosine reductase